MLDCSGREKHFGSGKSPRSSRDVDVAILGRDLNSIQESVEILRREMSGRLKGIETLIEERVVQVQIQSLGSLEKIKGVAERQAELSSLVLERLHQQNLQHQENQKLAESKMLEPVVPVMLGKEAAQKAPEALRERDRERQELLAAMTQNLTVLEHLGDHLRTQIQVIPEKLDVLLHQEERHSSQMEQQLKQIVHLQEEQRRKETLVDVRAKEEKVEPIGYEREPTPSKPSRVLASPSKTPHDWSPLPPCQPCPQQIAMPPPLEQAGDLLTQDVASEVTQQANVRRMSLDDNEASDEGLEPMELRIDGAFGQIFFVDEAEDLETLHYMVEDYYYTTGHAQALARSEYFINFSLFVICLNAVYLGVDADWNDQENLYDAHTVFIVFENCFCCYFVFEWVVRFLSFKRTTYAVRDGWFKFDTCLVALAVFETWIFNPILKAVSSGGMGIPVAPLRLLRLLRLTRMARLMRSLPELVTLCKGAFIASRAVGSSLLMVALIVYVFAIVEHMLLSKKDDLNQNLITKTGLGFNSITRCMWTLMIAGTLMLDGAGDVLTTLMYRNEFDTRVAAVLFLVFMLLSSITVLNMLIGVLCEVVSQVGRREKDAAAIRLVKENILLELKKMDDGDGLISHDELMKVMDDPQSKRVLRSLNVDRLFMLELQRMYFPNAASKVRIKDAMELMIMCRGDNPTTVDILAHGLSYLSKELKDLRASLRHDLLRVTSVNSNATRQW